MRELESRPGRRAAGREKGWLCGIWKQQALWGSEDDVGKGLELPALSGSFLLTRDGHHSKVCEQTTGPHQPNAQAFPFRMRTSAQNRDSLRTLSLMTGDAFLFTGMWFGVVLSVMTRDRQDTPGG